MQGQTKYSLSRTSGTAKMSWGSNIIPVLLNEIVKIGTKQKQQQQNK